MPKFDKEHLKELAKEASDRHYARSKVTNAIKNGSLKKEPCFCGSVKVEAHHADYSRPLDVIWCCKKHHIELDRMRKNDVIRAKTGLIL